jgi:spoIIIJ-associated protein
VSETEVEVAEDANAAHAANTLNGTQDIEHVEALDEADDSDAVEGADSSDRADSSALLVREGDVAADYLERLLDIVDYDGDIDLDVENDRAIVAIVGDGLRSLIGPRGETLDALQELTRLAVQQKTGVRSRLMLDVSGHRAARRQELAALATDTAHRAIESGESVRMTAMNPFERKVVHDTITAITGVRSESEGEEPNRRVVVLVEQ